MTQQTPPPDIDPNQNPRAAAKAAKAYAKATRPWYKKKRWIGLIVIAVIVVIAVATSGGDSDADPEKVSGGDSSKAADTNKAGTKSNPIKVGETVKLEGTQYTVKSAKTSAEVGSEYFKETAGGIYVIVEMTIENKKDETKTFSESAAKFVGGNGKTYSTDDDGSIAADEPLILEDMQPDVPKTGLLVYDVPKNATSGGVLKVSDLFGGGDAFIDLGLK